MELARKDNIPGGMSDVDATRMGYKSYSHGTTYNNSISPTVSGTNLTTVRGVFIPYQMQDGSWRMKGNLQGTISVGTSAINVTINGAVFKDGGGGLRQAVTAYSSAGSGAIDARTVNNTSVIDVKASTNMVNIALAFDIELESKPTWAY